MTKREFQMLKMGEHIWTKDGRYEPIQWFAFFNGKKWTKVPHEDANGAFVGFGDYKEYIHSEDMSLKPTKKLRQSELSLMTIKELKELCEREGWSTKGNKTELLVRIRRALGTPTVVIVSPK